MRQLMYIGPGSLEWRETPEPRLLSDEGAIVRPVAVATCDLDALIVAGTSPFPAPFPLGHECVAEVLEVGDSVGSVAPGQLVSVPFQISCGTCGACLAGRTSNCAEVPFMSTYGFGPAVDRWGGFLSDAVEVPYAEHMLVPCPPAWTRRRAASASDNLSDAWRAVGPALEELPGADVLVVGGAGPGSIGLYAAGLAVALGSGSVLYVDGDVSRREIAARLGAQTLAEKPKRVGPYPITVDASGDPDGLELALRSTSADGSAPARRSTSATSPACRCSRCTRRASRSAPAASTLARRCPTCSGSPPPATSTPSSSPRDGSHGSRPRRRSPRAAGRSS